MCACVHVCVCVRVCACVHVCMCVHAYNCLELPGRVVVRAPVRVPVLLLLSAVRERRWRNALQ